MFSKGREEKSDNVSTGRIETVYYWRTLELENRITRFLHKVRLPLLLEDFNSIICLTGNCHGARNCLQKILLCIIFFCGKPFANRASEIGPPPEATNIGLWTPQILQPLYKAGDHFEMKYDYLILKLCKTIHFQPNFLLDL